MRRRLSQLWLLALLSATSISILIVMLMLNQQIQQEYQSMALWSEELGNYARRQQAPPATLLQALTNQGYRVQLVRSDNDKVRVWVGNSQSLNLQTARQVLQSGNPEQGYRRIDGDLYLYRTSAVLPDAVVVIYRPMMDLYTGLVTMGISVLVVCIALLLVLFAVFRRLVQPLTQRLHRADLQHSMGWQHMSGIALQLTESHYILDASPRFKELYGAIDGKRFEAYLHQACEQRVQQCLQRALSQQQVIQFDCQLVNDHGEHKVWSLNARPVKHAGRRYLLLNGDDISQRSHSERKLLIEQQRLTTYFNAMQTLLVICDPAGVVLRINDQIRHLLELPDEQVLGRPLFSLLPRSHAERMRQQWQQMVAGEPPNEDLEYPIIAANGKSFLISWRITRVEGDNPNDDDFLLAGVDITVRTAQQQALTDANEKIREALQEAEAANRSKTIFLANMSHEIRTPMNGVLGAAELLQESTLDAEQAGYLDIITKSSHSLISIINDILDLSKIESGNLEIEFNDFNLHDLIQDLYQLFSDSARRKELALTSVYQAELPACWRGDMQRIRQVLTNLISNAIKFTETGQIHIEVSAAVLSETRYQVKMSVTDTGIGIAEDKLEHVFSAFRQADSSTSRRYGGTGLGLTISRRLAVAMQGDILVESKPGEGSKFCLSIPLTVGDARNVVAPSEPRKAQALRFKGQVLLAEDNPVNQKITLKILEKLGFDAEVAENGDIAINALRQRHFDLVLMDINMPVVDGIEATERIRDLGAPRSLVPILALTANAMMEDQERCLAAGMNGFVAKPIKPDRLADAIAKVAPSLRVDE
ncbi:PAS domain-containing hybrid sensor histidine kinase/response regulator [Bacterioplanes sanyensis]|nr:ATP-binding protein [Bacterioplanes sanyensis]